MTHHMSTRQHLLDENSMRQAIRQTGFHRNERARIADALTEHYIVDLDLLASILIADESGAAPVRQAA